MSYRVGRVIGSKGPSFRAQVTSNGIDVGARRNYDHEQAAVKKAEDDKKKREDLIKQRNQEAERRMKDTMREEMDSKGTEARVKIKNVSRPDNPEPNSADSKLSKTGQIKTKIIDEEKPLMSDKTLGLPGGLIAAARAVMEKKHDFDDDDARKMKGGKTEVDLEPETDDDVRDDSDKKAKKTVKEAKDATHPKTDKEKKLAALAHPKDKITHKDVLVGRGVLAKEEVDLESLTEEELEEVLKKSDPAGTWIKDFVKSDNPKFAGKSKKKRMQMALGAYYAKQRNEEIEIDEAAKKPGSVPVVTKKIDFEKVKQVRDARKAAKQARHQDTSHLPPGWKTTWNRNEETDMELSDEELERLNEIAAQLDEKITPSELRAQLKAKAAAKKTNDSETKSTTVNESTKTHHQLMASYHERMASAKDVSDSEKEMHEKAFQQHRKASVKPEAYSSSANKMTKALLKEEVELDEINMNAVMDRAERKSGAAQYKELMKKKAAAGDEAAKRWLNPSLRLNPQQSQTKTVSKEEVELDEAKRGRPKKNPTPEDEQDEHEHVIMQLRKVVSTHGALPVKHLDGKSTKLTPQLAQHALNKHNAMKTADQKQDFEQKLHKSHDSMRAALGG